MGFHGGRVMGSQQGLRVFLGVFHDFNATCSPGISGTRVRARALM